MEGDRERVRWIEETGESEKTGEIGRCNQQKI